MNKFIKIAVGSTIFGLLAAMISFWFSLLLQTKLKPAELKPLWQATMPPPMSISPIFFLLLGILLLGFLRFRRKH